MQQLAEKSSLSEQYDSRIRDLSEEKKSELAAKEKEFLIRFDEYKESFESDKKIVEKAMAESEVTFR